MNLSQAHTTLPTQGLTSQDNYKANGKIQYSYNIKPMTDRIPPKHRDRGHHATLKHPTSCQLVKNQVISDAKTGATHYNSQNIS